MNPAPDAKIRNDLNSSGRSNITADYTLPGKERAPTTTSQQNQHTSHHEQRASATGIHLSTFYLTSYEHDSIHLLATSKRPSTSRNCSSPSFQASMLQLSTKPSLQNRQRVYLSRFHPITHKHESTFSSTPQNHQPNLSAGHCPSRAPNCLLRISINPCLAYRPFEQISRRRTHTCLNQTPSGTLKPFNPIPRWHTTIAS